MRIQTGPQFGFNINDSFVDGSESGTLDAKGLDLGIVFGAQYEFPMGLFVQSRYQLGQTVFRL
ncbi:hypothetical protein [Maribacter sp.]|uniref:hypothetical protein n=1 Tax=Maribacter sp. TaxID=1897614 RepID=UPI003C7764B1